MDQLQGAYSPGRHRRPRKLIAVRDPHGLPPAVYGQAWARAIIIASESLRVRPPWAPNLCGMSSRARSWWLTQNGCRSIRTHCGGPYRRCASLNTSILPVRIRSSTAPASHRARRRAGAFLALEHPVQADVVIGVPDSGLDAALGYAQQSGIPYGIGFLKNKYIGRTFIQPTQKQREDDVRIKLNPIASVRCGASGWCWWTTPSCAAPPRLKIVKLLREAGAKEVHMRLSAPPFLYPCYFGTDIDCQREPDRLPTHSLEEMPQHHRGGQPGLPGAWAAWTSWPTAPNAALCTGCFTGQIPGGAAEKRREKQVRDRRFQHRNKRGRRQGGRRPAGRPR